LVPDIYIVGDFNYPEIDWDLGNTSGEAGTTGKDLMEFLDCNFFTQVVNQPDKGGNTQASRPGIFKCTLCHTTAFWKFSLASI
jgi:hypothetical protein